ncbi:unnamed protein product [Hymenolepis diminuta]|uniref:RRM domain-containing protein n=2 Tax=Hymenolepis diminuta TaxID=6216 RepID=A0A564XYW2_HYMDI|nr:unnamed protein product [Hymenolepis diminuta]
MVKIFVGGLNRGSKSDDLRARFEVFGKVTECEIISTYAFVHMENESEANQAISKLHLTEFNGARISVELSHGRKRGGPLRYRDRRQDSRDRSRGPYDRDGSRKTDRPDLYPSMRDDRYNSSNSWYYDYLPHGHSQREYDSYEGRTYVSSSRHDSRMGTRGDYYYGDYYGYGYQSVPAPRDVRRGSSIDRSRYDSYGDYGRYRDYGHTSDRSTQPPTSHNDYDRYDSRAPPTSYDYSGAVRGYYEVDRDAANYGSAASSSYDYGHSRSRSDRSPPRNDYPYGYGRY